MAKRTKVHVNGDTLTRLLCLAGISSRELAANLQVSPTTIASYEASTIFKPHLAEVKKLEKIAEFFDVSLLTLVLDREQIRSNGKSEFSKSLTAAHNRFAGSGEYRSIAGSWHASSIDVPIPGELEYTYTTNSWQCLCRIIQDGNTFVARGLDHGEDTVLAEGVLFECGNYVRFHYFNTSERLRLWGTGVLKYLGDGASMVGYFLGRDAGQSPSGLMFAKILFKREEG